MSEEFGQNTLECDLYLESIHGLKNEQDKVTEQEKKIHQDENLYLRDKKDAMKGARSLSRTINDLISNQKEKMSEFY